VPGRNQLQLAARLVEALHAAEVRAHQAGGDIDQLLVQLASIVFVDQHRADAMEHLRIVEFCFPLRLNSMRVPGYGAAE